MDVLLKGVFAVCGRGEGQACTTSAKPEAVSLIRTELTRRAERTTSRIYLMPTHSEGLVVNVAQGRPDSCRRVIVIGSGGKA